jgi:ATP citrate (pro-S)-lyase
MCIGETLSIPIHVFGPETHMTSVVGMALGKKAVTAPAQQQATTANFLLPGSQVC